LLASSRVLHPDPAVRSRACFVAALRAREVPADPPRISRWESGAHPAQPHVIAAYEDILGLRPGTISAVTVGMRRAFGSHVPARDQGRRHRIVRSPPAGGAAGPVIRVRSARPRGNPKAFPGRPRS
jgi:hypothetical protein